MIHQSLGAAGYRCGWFGKWHLSKERSAADFGFEGFSLAGYGYPYNTDDYRAYLERNRLNAPVATVELSGESRRTSGTRIALADAKDWFDYEAGTTIIEGDARTHEAYFVSALAEDWLRTVGDQSFFLRVDTWGPHPPYMVAPPFDGMFPDLTTAASENLVFDLGGRPGHHADYRGYWQDALPTEARDYALLSRRALQQAALCETALLRLVHVLEETGKIDDTVIIYCADHGDAVASNGGVLNKGGLMVEETLRIPLVIAGPGIAGHRVLDDLVGNIDLVPTILDAAGLDRPGLDGISLWPLLTKGRSPERPGLMCEHYGLHVPVMQRSWHEGRWKLVVQEDGYLELYDLEDDPCELRNLASAPRHDDRRTSMRAALRREMERSGDPALTRMAVND